jgi:hypothetical protein
VVLMTKKKVVAAWQCALLRADDDADRQTALCFVIQLPATK